MELDFIVRALSAELLQKGERFFFDQISFDSRGNILPETLFFCFAGNYHNGHDFIPFLYQKGVRGFVISQPVPVENYPRASFFLCKNITKSLQNLAKEKRKLFKIPVIGITGSNGKTIVKEWLYEILSQELMVLRSPKSYNSQIGVPFSVLLLDEKYELAIFEAGISQLAEMNALEEMIQPELGVFTNISEAHSKNFQDTKEKINEKLNLFKNSKIIFYSQDQPEVVQAIQERFPNKKKCTWGKTKEADLQILEVKKIETNRYLLIFQYKNKKNQIFIPFADPFSLENIYTVLTIVSYFNLLEKVKNHFFFLSSLAMRSEFLEGDQNSLIINDAYTIDLQALRLSLDALFQLEEYKKKTLIVSDFLEDKNPNLYVEIASLLARYPLDQLIGIGENFNKNKHLFNNIKKSFFYKETIDIFKDIVNIDLKEQAILVKGARKFHLEKVAHFLQRKKHQTWLEIRLDALEKNLTFFKSIVPPKTKMMVMVKARSYGSSEIETAQFLQQKGVDYFGVAFESEGIALRENRIHLPILVMQAIPDRLLIQLAHQLEPTLYSFAIFEAYIEKIKQEKLKKINFHIKIDTGMHRMGFVPEQVSELLNLIKKNKDLIKIKTVYTHLAGAEDPGYDFFTQKQLDDFSEIKNKFTEFDSTIDFHVLNSAGIQRFSSYAYDMVRLGIGLYGVEAVTDSHLDFAIKCKTKIIHLQKFTKGTPIGYNGKTILDQDTTVATLPIGYADGLKRGLGNKKWSVWIGNKLCPIVGNICMDFTMVDVGDLAVDLDQEVLIFGENQCSVQKMAAVLETNAYEILTSMSGRINRVFLKE